MWYSAADTHLKLLDRAVSGTRFLTGGVFECDISHRRSVAVLCMLYKIRCNRMHPLNGALPGPYVPVRVTRDALIAHLYTYAPPRCRTLQYHKTFILLSVSLWNDLADSVFDGVGLAGFKTNAFLLALAVPSLLWSTIFPFLFYYFSLSFLSFPFFSFPFLFYYFSLSFLSVYRLVLWGLGLGTDREYITLSQPCTADHF